MKNGIPLSAKISSVNGMRRIHSPENAISGSQRHTLMRNHGGLACDSQSRRKLRSFKSRPLLGSKRR